MEPRCNLCGRAVEPADDKEGRCGIETDWLATDLLLLAVMPVARYVEYLTPSPYLDEIVAMPIKGDMEGYLPIPDEPGLGIELNREA